MQNRDRTKQRIAEACIELLSTTTLEALRTQELMEKAGVSRSSFYRAFPDKYAVANWIYQEQAEEIIWELPELKSWKEWTYVLHDYMRQHKRFFRNIAGYRGQNSFGSFLFEYFIGNIGKYRSKELREMTEDQRFAVRAFSIIGAQATIEWIMNDFQPDDETLVHRLEACIPACIRDFYT